MVAREVNGRVQLVAYVVAVAVRETQEDAAFIDHVRAHVRAGLPQQMVPSQWALLTALPRLPNGKLDRRALPQLQALSLEPVPPRTSTESTLLGIWQHVLGTPRIGVTDNFFELGGDSILSLQIVARARRPALY